MKKQIFSVYTKKKLETVQIIDIMNYIIDASGKKNVQTIGSHRHDKRGVKCTICSQTGKKGYL